MRGGFVGGVRGDGRRVVRAVWRVAGYRPKGPTHCFRQFNIDWSWISPRPDQLPALILHLIGDGAYTINVSGGQVPATRAGDQYPADGWTQRVERTKSGLRIHVEGHAQDRLLVLE